MFLANRAFEFCWIVISSGHYHRVRHIRDIRHGHSFGFAPFIPAANDRIFSTLFELFNSPDVKHCHSSACMFSGFRVFEVFFSLFKNGTDIPSVSLLVSQQQTIVFFQRFLNYLILRTLSTVIPLRARSLASVYLRSSSLCSKMVSVI